MIQGTLALMPIERRTRLRLGSAGRELMEEVPSTSETSQGVANTNGSRDADGAPAVARGGGAPPQRLRGDRRPPNRAQPPTYASGSD